MKKYIISAIAGLAVLLIVSYGIVLYPLSAEQSIRLLFTGEHIGMYEINTAKNAAKRAPAYLDVQIGGKDYQTPLPNGSTSYDNGYLVCYDEFKEYLDRLPSLGYELQEQFGSSSTYKNTKLSLKMELSSSNFTGAFQIFNIKLTTI